MEQISYEIPMIHCDLRQEEMIVQIADALDYLNTVVSDIFQRIDSKISKSKIKLNELKKRAEIANTKIIKLAGRKKATKVFSSAKYPAKDVHTNYESMFSITTPSAFMHCDIPIKSKHLHPDASELQDRLQFFHVKTSSKLLRRNMEVAPEEGLGSLPKDLDSVSTLLLFNTSENPYQRYVMLDPLGALSKSRHILDEEDRHMEAAPLSISQREQIEDDIGENYFYSPGLGEVPLIDVPLDLPDLPGVADDLRYSMDSEPAIAPSVSTTPAVSDLPSPLTASLPEFSDVRPPEPLSFRRAPATQPPVHPPPAAVPPPPPQQQQQQQRQQLPPPPPPPPPPHSEPGPSATAPPIDEMRLLAGGDSGGDPRATLMEAIRKVGGSEKAKLRSVNDRSSGGKTKKKDEKQTDTSDSNSSPGVEAKGVNDSRGGGGDFMADLHAKLALRRKGISGLKTDSPATGVMSRISAMIPPPEEVPSISAANTDYDDEDWE